MDKRITISLVHHEDVERRQVSPTSRPMFRCSCGAWYPSTMDSCPNQLSGREREMADILMEAHHIALLAVADESDPTFDLIRLILDRVGVVRREH